LVEVLPLVKVDAAVNVASVADIAAELCVGVGVDAWAEQVGRRPGLGPRSDFGGERRLLDGGGLGRRLLGEGGARQLAEQVAAVGAGLGFQSPFDVD
jgi:hypothetical protein